METTDTGLPPRFSGLVPAGTDGTGHEARHRHPSVSAGSGAETPSILADALPTLARVHGVVRLPAWDLAVECVEEALDSGVAPSLQRLGRPAQLGALPSFIAALEEDEDPAEAAADFARERRASGSLPPRSSRSSSPSAASSNATASSGRARQSTAASWGMSRAPSRVRRPGNGRDALTGLLDRSTVHAQVTVEAARARRYRGSVAFVLFDLDCSAERADRDRLLRAFATSLTGALRETDVAGRVGGAEFAAVLPAAGSTGADAFVLRVRRELADGVSVERRHRLLPRRVCDRRAAPPEGRAPPLLGQSGQGRVARQRGAADGTG